MQAQVAGPFIEPRSCPSRGNPTPQAMQPSTLNTSAAAAHVLILLRSMARNDLRTRAAAVVEMTSPIAICVAVEFNRARGLDGCLNPGRGYARAGRPAQIGGQSRCAQTHTTAREAGT